MTDDAAAAPVTDETVAATTPAPVTETAQPTPSQPAEVATTNDAVPAEHSVATASAQPAPASEAAPAATAAAQPATSQDQVAQAVTRDFVSYDKDGDGSLNAAEFGAWMSSLRKASEPTFVAGTPEATKWEAQAFTAADADKSASVNQAELTTFLTPKPS